MESPAAHPGGVGTGRLTGVPDEREHMPAFSNPNGEGFDPEGLPQPGRGPFWMRNHPVQAFAAGT